MWLNLVGQACFPARRLGLVIRIAGIDEAMHRTEKTFALALDMFMTLQGVEQSLGASVKAPAVRQTLPIRSRRLSCLPFLR